ncbi:MAG: LamG domain-containing protein [Verrucomicrobiota bacterium]
MSLKPTACAFICLLFCPYSYSQATTLEPTIHWRMEENGNDTMKNHDLLQLENITFSDDRVEGSHSMQFDSSRSSKSIITNRRRKRQTSFINESHYQRTYSLWFKTKESSASRPIKQFILNIGSGNGSAIYLQDSQLVGTFTRFNNNPRAWFYFSLKTDFPFGKWNHVVLRFDNGEGALFLNGIIAAKDQFLDHNLIRSDIVGSALGAPHDWYFDVDSGLDVTTFTPENHFDGLIDDVKIFSTALSDKDIQNLFLRKNTTAVEPSTELVKANTVKQPTKNKSSSQPTMSNTSKTNPSLNQAVEPSQSQLTNDKSLGKHYAILMAFFLISVGVVVVGIGIFYFFKK